MRLALGLPIALQIIGRVDIDGSRCVPPGQALDFATEIGKQ